VLLIITSFNATALTNEARAVVDFMQQVRPMLSKHSLSCHVPDEAARETGLRLDTPAAAFAEADSGLHAIVPGNGAESELVARLTTADEYLQMPPISSGKSISPDEVATLRRFIEQGPTYQKPFDQFTIERLAGDLLLDPTMKQKIAPGFHRNAMKNTAAGADRELDRVI